MLQIEYHNLPLEKSESGNPFTSHRGPVSKGRIFSRTSGVPLSAFDLC